MAKKSNTTQDEATMDAGETPTYGGVTLEPMALSFDGHSVSTDALPPASLAYLLQYGFAQCLQDMSLAQIRAGAERKGLEMTPAEVQEALTARRLAKVENLLTGQIFARRPSAPRATTFDKKVMEVVKERVAAAIAKVLAQKPGFAAPKGDALQAAYSRYLEKHRDDVHAEAQRRLDSSGIVDMDLEDLF